MIFLGKFRELILLGRSFVKTDFTMLVERGIFLAALLCIDLGF